MLRLLSVIFFGLLLFISPFPCYATREFKVYSAETAVEGELETSVWNNYTSSNSQPYLFRGNSI
ncbi:MAG: hypothetical protein ACHQYP_07135, partial [Nitrospiria bacterium]